MQTEEIKKLLRSGKFFETDGFIGSGHLAFHKSSAEKVTKVREGLGKIQKDVDEAAVKKQFPKKTYGKIFKPTDRFHVETGAPSGYVTDESYIFNAGYYDFITEFMGYKIISATRLKKDRYKGVFAIIDDDQNIVGMVMPIDTCVLRARDKERKRKAKKQSLEHWYNEIRASIVAAYAGPPEEEVEELIMFDEIFRCALVEYGFETAEMECLK